MIDLNEQLYKINKFATQFYQEQLEKSQRAQTYLKHRKINSESIKVFKLGYAPEGNELYQALIEQGYTNEEIEMSGLVIIDEQGTYTDKHSNRIILPIINEEDKVVALAGRSLDDINPKYIITANNEIYKRLQNLYGINLAKNYAQKSLIVVEGFFDVITLHQNGIKNVVALMGIIFTGWHVQLIKQYTNKVHIIFDGDIEGEKATKRAKKLLEGFDIEYKYFKIHDAKDPDEYVRRFGSKEFKNLNSTIELIYNTKKLRVVRLKSCNQLPFVDEAKIDGNNNIILNDKSFKFTQDLSIETKQMQFYNDIFAIYNDSDFQLCNNKNIKIKDEQIYGEILFIKIIENEFYELSIDETDFIINKLKHILDELPKISYNHTDEVKAIDNKVYHLKLSVCFELFFEDKFERSYQNIYYSLESARNKGLEWLQNIINSICKKLDYMDFKEDSENVIEEYISMNILKYQFTVTEIEPNYASKFEIDYQTKEDCVLNEKPTHIVYVYNYDGNLNYKELQWQECYLENSTYRVRRYEGDELENAGTKFKIGDFVKVKNFTHYEDDLIHPLEIFVVKNVPIKVDGKFIDENAYGVANIRNNKISGIRQLYESEIEEYSGEIQDNSPGMLLSKIYKNEIKVSKDIMKRIEYEHIVLNDEPSWRDIKELNI